MGAPLSNIVIMAPEKVQMNAVDIYFCVRYHNASSVLGVINSFIMNPTLETTRHIAEHAIGPAY